MADISINSVSMTKAPVVTQSAPAKTVAATGSGAGTASVQTADKGLDAAKKATESTRKAIENAQKDSDRRTELRAREETATKEFGPVVAKSGDGDTLRVKSETEQVASSEESKIYDNSAVASTVSEAPKPEVQDFEIPKPEITQTEAPKPEYVPFEFPDDVKNQNADTTQSTQNSASAVSEKSAQASNVKNASESELERMYLQGDISRVQYNSEKESREEKIEAEKTENNQFASEMATDAAKEVAGEREAEAIELLGSEDSSDVIPVEVREQFVENMDFNV